jgi:molybdate transport system substrate-binding protein
MGIADTIKPKLTIMQAIDGGVDLVAKGKAEVGLFNISEILPVPGVALVGALPASVQNYIVFAAALHAGSRSPGLAQAFVKLASDPATRAQWSAGGLESMSGS